MLANTANVDRAGSTETDSTYRDSDQRIERDEMSHTVNVGFSPDEAASKQFEWFTNDKWVTGRSR